MFISNELVFIELHKTAGTHIGKLLASLVNGVQNGKHNPAPLALINSQRKFIGSVRNPWDWYLSLWAYGCSHEGLVYHYATQALTPDELKKNTPSPAIFLNAKPPQGNNSPLRKPQDWQRCYSNVHDASAFRDWLHFMNDKNYWNDFREGYGASPISNFAGLLTYRYVGLFCKRVQANITCLADLQAYEKKQCFIDHFIRTENLESDFISTMKSCGVHLNKAQKRSINSTQKTNTSAQRKKTAYYYDKETIELVRKREQLIIEKFSHSPPS